MPHRRSSAVLRAAGRACLIWVAACSIPRTPFTPAEGPVDADVATPDAPPAGGGLRVAITGAGVGTVAVTHAGAPCDAACQAGLANGEVAQLTAAAAAGSWFRGWTTACSGRHGCAVTVRAGLVVTAEFTPQPNRVFVSSTLHDGNFGGLGAGDAICQGLATAAGLAGQYRLLLVPPMQLPASRALGGRGWIRTDDEPVWDAATSIGLGAGWFPITFDERGLEVPISAVWGPFTTGTNCGGWATTAGSDGPWYFSLVAGRLATPVAGAAQVCGAQQRFLCLGVDRVVPVAPAPTTGRLAFATAGLWNPTQGIAAADTLCAAEAANAGKAGVFLALLADVGAAATVRFDLTGAPWVRVDGLPLVASAKALETTNVLRVAPGMRLDGTASPVLTLPLGAPAPGVAGLATTTCAGYTSATASIQSYDSVGVVANYASSCGPMPVICLQR